MLSFHFPWSHFRAMSSVQCPVYRAIHTGVDNSIFIDVHARCVILFINKYFNYSVAEIISRCRLSTYGCQAFYHACLTFWILLSDELRNSDSFMTDGYKRFVKTILFSRY